MMIPNPESQTRSVRRQIGVGGCMITQRARQLVQQVLDSERLSAGPMMERFEQEIARLHGARFGLMCNSGTSALHIALAALKEKDNWQDGDEILVPALTFVATSNVVLYNNLKPVFVDVEPDYYCMNPRRIEARITRRTRAIMPVHIGGLPCEMNPICDIAKKYGLRIIEDCAEAMFAKYRGKPVGSFSDIGCFSTYVAHMISTGVGGLCTTNDPELFVILKSLMNHGRDSIYTRIDDDQGLQGQALLEIARSRFSFVRLGHSFRATEMEAALGLAELEDRERNCARRREVASMLIQGLQPYADQLQLPRPRPNVEHAYMFFPLVILNPKIQRDEMIQFLEDRFIETRYLLPLINQPIYRKLFGNLDDQYPVAAWLNKNAFYIGCHPEMTDEDVQYILDCFHEFFQD